MRTFSVLFVAICFLSHAPTAKSGVLNQILDKLINGDSSSSHGSSIQKAFHKLYRVRQAVNDLDQRVSSIDDAQGDLKAGLAKINEGLDLLTDDMDSVAAYQEFHCNDPDHQESFTKAPKVEDAKSTSTKSPPTAKDSDGKPTTPLIENPAEVVLQESSTTGLPIQSPTVDGEEKSPPPASPELQNPTSHQDQVAIGEPSGEDAEKTPTNQDEGTKQELASKEPSTTIDEKPPAVEDDVLPSDQQDGVSLASANEEPPAANAGDVSVLKMGGAEYPPPVEDLDNTGEPPAELGPDKLTHLKKLAHPKEKRLL